MASQIRPGAPPTETPEQRSIQSVVVGFRLIRALEAHPEPMTLKDLASAAGMVSGKAHAYLASFRAIGLVRQEEGGRYALGPYALTLGLAALGRLDVREAASGPMRRFRDTLGSGIYLSVWSGEAPVIVSRLDGAAAQPVSIRVGFALPLDISATGRVFLAFLPEAERRLATLPGGTAMAPALLDRIVKATRRRGLARTDSLLNVGFVALSAPVFDHEGALAGALTALGPAGAFDTRFEGETAVALASAAAAASEALGYRVAMAANNHQEK
jgi:DNA-binding IclR family transcriptional regulator